MATWPWRPSGTLESITWRVALSMRPFRLCSDPRGGRRARPCARSPLRSESPALGVLHESDSLRSESLPSERYGSRFVSGQALARIYWPGSFASGELRRELSCRYFSSFLAQSDDATFSGPEILAAPGQARTETRSLASLQQRRLALEWWRGVVRRRQSSDFLVHGPSG